MPRLRRTPPRARRAHDGEDDLQEAVRKLAKLYGWLYYHTHDSRKSPRGFPDTVLVKRGRLLFVELKLPGRYLTTHQRVWANALHLVEVATERRVRYLVVRPDDLQALADELAHAA